MRHLRLADCCYGAAIVTMPLSGVGLVHLFTGVDTGAGLQPAYLFLAFAWVLRVADIATPGGRIDRSRLADRADVRRGLMWVGLAMGVVLVSALGLRIARAPIMTAEAWPRFLKQTVQLAVMVAFLVYPALWTRGPRRWQWTLSLLALATSAQLIYAGLQTVHQLIALPGMQTLDSAATSNPAILAGSDRLYLGGYTAVPRLRGSMSEPLYLGSYLLAVIPILTLKSRRVLVFLSAAALFLTWSRGAWLAAAGGLFVWWILRRRAGLSGPSRRVVLTTAGLGIGVAALVAAVMGAETLLLPIRRIVQTFDQGDWSNLTRVYSLQAGWRCFLESPLVGVGWGQFPYHFYALVDLPGLESQFTWPVVNCMPLLVLCETGLLGFAVLSAAVVAVCRNTWRALSRANDPLRAARLAALAAGSCGLGLHLLIFSQYNLPHLWVVPGLWLAALVEEGNRS